MLVVLLIFIIAFYDTFTFYSVTQK